MESERDRDSTLLKVQALVERDDVLISVHGYRELAADNILAEDVLAGLDSAVVVEDYPNYAKGPCILVLQHDRGGTPVHVVCGIPKGHSRPAVLVTAYRPDPKKWTGDLMRRR